MTDADAPWGSDHDRKLMVRAVARFSDECEAPELTPSCPFYELTADGSPVCAEQCQDLIARYPADLQSKSQLGLGGGLNATRRRPRRGPDPAERAFDATQGLLQDENRPLGEWQLSSLLLAARTLAFSPQEVPHVRGAAVLDELVRRGVAAELLAMGLARARADALQVALFMCAMPGGESFVDSITASFDDWRSSLEAIGGLAANADESPYLNSDGRNAIYGWAATADPAALLSDVVPSADELRLGLAHELDEDDVAQARWMLDRFATTYLHDWHSTSLVREWKFAKAEVSGCCPPGLMRQRAIDPGALSSALADEHCRVEGEQNPRSWTKAQLKSMAISRLHAGETEAAVNHFRVLRELSPHDVEVANNLGFCLLAVDPVEAIEPLQTALRMGAEIPALTAFNLGLALHLQADNYGAYALLERTLSEGSGHDGDVYVWKVEDGNLVFSMVDDLLDYGEDLARHVLECAGGCIPELAPS